MDSNKHIDTKIKDSFGQMKRPSPKDLWGSIADKLNNSEPDVNLDKQVKQSFENLNSKIPDHVWDNVNRQLNIDLVWKRTKRVLDIRTAVRKWSRAAALLLILLLIGWGGYVLRQPTQPIIGLHKPNSSPESKEASGKKTINNPNQNLTVASIDNGKETEDTLKKTINSDEVTTLPEVAQLTVADKVPQSRENVIYSDRKKGYDNIPSRSNNPGIIENYDANGFIPIDSILKIHPKSAVLISQPIDTIVELALLPVNTDVPRAGEMKKRSFELGLIGSLNNTWLINNETKNGLRSESLVKTHPTFASSYGLLFNCNLDNKNVIATEMLLHSAIHQHYNLYQEGKYLSKDIDLEYYKIGLLYQRNILQHGRLISSNYTLKIGGYLAYLKEKSRIIDGKIASVADDYDDFDYGFKAAIGQEKTFNRFILGYGIVGEIGVNNIFTGNEKIPSDFDLTRNRSIGAYLSLRYKL